MLDQRLWQLAKQGKKQLLLTIGCSLALGALVVAQALLLAKIIHGVMLQGQGLREVLPLLALLLAVMTARALFGWLEDKTSAKLAQGVQNQLRRQILDKIETLGPVALKSQQTGELVNLATQGVDLLEDYFSKYIPQLFRCALIPLLLLAIVFPFDTLTGVILLVTAPLVPFFMMLIGSWTNKLNHKQWHLLSRLTGYLQDVIQGLTTLKLLNRSQGQQSKIAEISEQFRQATMKVLRVAFLSALTLELLTTLSIALVAVGLGLKLVNGNIGFYHAFFLILLAPDFYQPLRTLGSHYHASLNGVESANSIFAFLQQQPEFVPSDNVVKTVGEADTVSTVKLGIELQGLTYQYPSGQQPALQKLSLKIEPGQKVALIGPSGSGKSTLLNLLAGYLPPPGQIFVNGQDLAGVGREAWLQHLAVINQKPYLFTGTVQENILLGREDATEIEIEALCGQLGLTPWLAGLPHGLATQVQEGEGGVSGGQRQIIALLRACLKNPPLVLLDEATANLDLATEQLLNTGLQKFLQDKTAVIAAHRFATLQSVDKIVVLEQGRVLAAGTHRQLLASCSWYQNLCAAQQAVADKGGEANGKNTK